MAENEAIQFLIVQAEYVKDQTRQLLRTLNGLQTAEMITARRLVRAYTGYIKLLEGHLEDEDLTHPDVEIIANALGMELTGEKL